ncbi:AAA family ATPase [Halomonas shantousis]
MRRPDCARSSRGLALHDPLQGLRRPVAGTRALSTASILLIGPPGTGKTSLAHGGAGMPFFRTLLTRTVFDRSRR